MVEESTILVDIPDGQTTDVAFLEGLGHTVVICHGPPEQVLCPILSGTGCPKAEQAHGVVFLLDLDRPQHRAILKRYQSVLPEDIPIRVKVSPDQGKQYASLLTGIHTWTHDPGVGDLDGFAAEVETADQFRY